MIGEADLFSQQYRPFLGRWPISGMMRNGVVYELPMQVHPTTDLESSSLPIQVLGTPTTATSGRSPEFRKGSNPNPVEFVEDLLRTPSVVDSTGGAISETQARERGRMVKVADQVAELAAENGLQVSESIKNSLLPTPAVGHIRNHDEPIEDYLARRQKMIDGVYKGMPGVSLGVAVRMEMLPTPQALEGHHGNNLSVEHRESQGRQVMLSNHAVDFANNQVTLLPTPDAYAAVRGGSSTPEYKKARGSMVTLSDQTEKGTNWGKFAPAIERWESLTRPAPAPTKPDGKDGNHRLSAEFTEWMMGLPEGWVTAEDIGLKRNDQLKACGNGVVPQQAELALRMLLQDTDFDSKLKVESALAKELTPHNR
jgi:hypothetical protein